MREYRMERRLSAILAADMVGSSRLMEADETGTLARQKRHQAELIYPRIEAHHGRIIKLTGDGLIAEFPSVVEAVQCAVSVQREMEAREADVPEDRRIRYRVAVNLGDVIFDDGEVYGNGVIVAARLEALAEPGGVVVSGTAYDHLKGSVKVGYEDLGPQHVKNIADPVRVYRVVPEAKDNAALPHKARRPWPVPVAVAAIIALLIAGGTWWWMQRPELTPADLAKMEYPLPDKPSIAVLPFNNLSGNPEQEYLSDGITENIIVTLSKIPEIFVIAGNSTFTYKKKQVKVQRVAEELGVRYVLEGSTQRSKDKVRITAQLIDAVTGVYLWSGRYDRDLHDLFALQDEITGQIVTSLQVELTEGDQARVWRRETDNAEAYEYYLRGVERWRQLSKAENSKAQRLLKKAVELDPGFVAAWVDLARTHYFAARFGWSESRDRSVARAAELAEKALTMDDSRAETYAMMTNVALLKGRHDEAIAHCQQALAHNPNSQVIALCARNLVFVNRPQEALELINRAMRLSPYYPGWYLYVLGDAHRLMGHYDEAIAAFNGWRNRNPNSTRPYIFLAYAFSMAGRDEEARAAVAEILKRDSNYSLKRLAKSLLYKDPGETERLLDALGKAGLPKG
jgi:adenylate cyclase